MERAKLHYLVDALMALTFLAVGGTGVIAFFVSGKSSLPLGISRKILMTVHEWAGLLLILLIIIHLMLHWNWIICMTKRMFERKSKVCKE